MTACCGTTACRLDVFVVFRSVAGLAVAVFGGCGFCGAMSDNYFAKLASLLLNPYFRASIASLPLSLESLRCRTDL